jgi:hypothetical protein
MEIELHIEKAEPDERWRRVQALGTGNLGRFISYRDDATFAWLREGNSSGIRLVTAHGSIRGIAESPVIEIRQYRIAPGQRARFAKFFVERCLRPLEQYGMAVYGAFDDVDDDTNFVWFRGFPSLVERDRRKAEFYGSKLWLEELQDEAFSIVKDYSNVLLAAPVK